MQSVKPTSRRRRRQRGRNGVRPSLFLLALLVAAACLIIPRIAGRLGLGGDCSVGGSIARPAFSLIQPKPLELNADDLYSSCALLIRLSDHAVLYEKNSDVQTYPASLTKMMTVLTFLETYASQGTLADPQTPETEDPTDPQETPDPQKLLERLQSENYTLPSEIFPILAKRHASMAGFQPGETVSLLDLVYACHLPSGADGSMGLAYSIAGSEQGFVDLMNQKAQELGMKNTHFTNVTGLHDPQHYTTAQDLAILMEHALKNPIYRSVLTAKKHEIAPTNFHPEGFTVHSTLAYKMQDLKVNRTLVLGGKTGYTGEAGLCLASLARKGSQEYILITTGAPGNNYTEQFNITDARLIYGAL
ncbi:D-alanyl-D-alanine carboxypeptidase family protein [Bacilliculturomica massiliensis]|uniref:D-alanyl-D-alanine carboxypeptidase family protein n=1 Tax=Bacilliculturomica massiliensis TaxID=1917867 RepID=UPI00103183E1|nr:D-alanyl-D-alanine carboxypeptidase [Bacilliculturomica massiliensis]